MAQKILFAVYDNGSYDHIFPMGFGALAAVLKRDGHDITVWNQDMHHWPDDYLRTYLDENKFDVAAKEMLDSRWANQVKSRATKLAHAMHHGEFNG